MPDGAAFVVRLQVFEGPLDLLLTLIQRQSLDINAVALAQVTGQYLEYLATLEELDAGALGQFIEVAATLLVIKSRSLLPCARPLAEGGPEDADAEELMARLRAYRQFRHAAEELGRRERSGLRAFARVAAPVDVPLPPPRAGEASVADLVAALQSALASAPVEPRGATGAIAPPAVRLADRVEDLRSLLSARRRVSFREVLTGGRRDREYVIVTFLAVLELLRRWVVRAVQSEIFGEIELELVADGGSAPVPADAEVRDSEG